ncbi:hypothetical protein [Streptomyces antibioticus]|uniref:hypothetical protein n=1 Tax=Streptomyces antibioticus TaxID=1890 RepID=UPI0033ADE748
MITKGVFSTALSLTVLAASTALGAGVAVADDGDAALDNTTLLGPVIAPILADGAAGNAAQNVNANVCDVSAALLGALVEPVAAAVCTGAAQNG